MKKTYDTLGVLVLALMVALLLLAGPASATTVSALQGSIMGVLDDGDQWFDPDDGTAYAEGWVAYGVWYRASAPDGERFIGYGVACLDVVLPAKGDNYHEGEVVWLGLNDDPLAFWDDDVSFWGNLAGHDLLWTGTWDGYTLNKRNHKVVLELDGVDGTANEGYEAVFDIQSGGFDLANLNSDNYVVTPWTALAYVTAP